MDPRSRKILETYDLDLDHGMIEFKRRLTAAEKARRKVGRNAPCPCGSGRKLKNCCLRRALG